MEIKPVTLEGSVVRLEPLTPAHHRDLCGVGLEPELWRWTSEAVESPEQMMRYIETALKCRDEGSALPFATCLKSSGRVVGSTRFANIDRPNRRVEIGWTWVGSPWQRTAVNTEAKHLMLRHAFEAWGCLRVEFKTDSLNQRSRAAILRIGASEEGVFRNHMITASGRIRHSVYYSIIESEWPSVKNRLEDILCRTG
jgi:RimJ/RimL family protein N-acetyltransferase